MFELYTIEGRRVIFFARAEAGNLGSPYIETEHLLLGIATAAQHLFADLLGLEDAENSFRTQIVAQSPAGEKIPSSQDMPLSNESKRVLAFAGEEAERLGDRFIGASHLLIGTLLERESFGARMLRERGADLEAFRIKLASSSHRETIAPEGKVSFSAAGLAGYTKRVHQSGHEQSKKTPPTPFGLHQLNEKSGRCIFFSRLFLSELGGDKIEPEHLLLAIIRETHPTVISFEEIKHEIQKSSGALPSLPPNSDVPLAENTKQVLQFAAEESVRLGSDSIAPEHPVLGIIREERNSAARILTRRGISPEAVRANIVAGGDWSQPLSR